MLNRIPLDRGTAVTVKFATHDGYIRHCATVIKDTEDGLYVEFASGMKQMVPHGEDRYERVREDA